MIINFLIYCIHYIQLDLQSIEFKHPAIQSFTFRLLWYFYHPQTKFAKVMFLHLSFICSQWGCLWPGPGEVGVCLGGVSRPRPRGGWGSALGVSRPRPKGKLGVCRGGSGPCPGGPGPGLGVSRPRPGVCMPACTEADTPPPQTATAADSTHPTGMHSSTDC